MNKTNSGMGQYISLIPSGLLSLEKRFLFASALHLQYDVEVLHIESCFLRCLNNETSRL